MGMYQTSCANSTISERDERTVLQIPGGGYDKWKIKTLMI